MSKIDLQELLNEYENNLCNKLFKYELTNKSIVEVVFYKEQFCHLLGLQYIYNNDKHYLGSSGYSKVKDGTLTTDSLIAHNLKQFNYIKNRLCYFGEIAELMYNGQLIRFYQDRTNPKTQISAEYLIIKDNKAYTLHLFLRKERALGSNNQYAPISFVIKSENDSTRKQYIDRQEFKAIVNKTITDL